MDPEQKDDPPFRVQGDIWGWKTPTSVVNRSVCDGEIDQKQKLQNAEPSEQWT